MPLYDLLCPWGVADDFFLALANEWPGSSVLDLGCGTGQLTLALAEAGHRVTGVEPARASLQLARSKPGAERVTWLEGTSSLVPDAAYDLALMTNHVALFMTGDAEWAAVLADLRRALKPGGRLAFDTRDPAARGWETWNTLGSRRTVTLPGRGAVDSWGEVTEVAGPLVTSTGWYDFHTPPERLVVWATLRFRTEQEVRASLQVAGFEIETIFGGWHGEPVGAGAGEFVVLARAPTSQ